MASVSRRARRVGTACTTRSILNCYSKSRSRCCRSISTPTSDHSGSRAPREGRTPGVRAYHLTVASSRFHAWSAMVALHPGFPGPSGDRPEYRPRCPGIPQTRIAGPSRRRASSCGCTKPDGLLLVATRRRSAQRPLPRRVWRPDHTGRAPSSWVSRGAASAKRRERWARRASRSRGSASG